MKRKRCLHLEKCSLCLLQCELDFIPKLIRLFHSQAWLTYDTCIPLLQISFLNYNLVDKNTSNRRLSLWYFTSKKCDLSTKGDL